MCKLKWNSTHAFEMIMMCYKTKLVLFSHKVVSKFTDYLQVIFHYKMNVLTIAAFVSFDNFSSSILTMHLDTKGHLKDNIEI